MIPALEPRLREVGRIRIGAVERYETARGDERSRPVKLDTFRLTSPNQPSIERAASIWGGEVTAWTDAPGEGEQWQVTTETAEIPVILPPQDIRAGQYFEQYSGGGCQRRCDGATELLTGGPCICAAEGQGDDRPCQITTHLLVILAMLPDVGVWRITTHGYNAALELPATVDLLAQVSAGRAPKALLRIEARSSKVAGEGRHDYSVPVLRSEYALTDVATHAGLPGAASPSLERPALSSGDPSGGGRPDDAPSPDAPAPDVSPEGSLDTRGGGAEVAAAAGQVEVAPAAAVDHLKPEPHAADMHAVKAGSSLTRCAFAGCPVAGKVAA